MINFMHKKYIKNVFVDKPQRDNFHFENLISNDEQTFSVFNNLNKNGFVVDSFVRDHVNIQIVFNEPIELHSIVLNSKVNSQISSGFIISSTIVVPNNNSPIDIKLFKQISRLVNDKNNTCYVYEFLRRNTSISDSNTNKAFFSISNQNYLNKLTAINVNIIKTLNSTNCCLKSLEINGYLSNSNQKSNETKKEEAHVKKTNIEIPSEFIDDITQEMIRIPVRLPSSKIIDKSTLDRCTVEQKMLKDPFTNLPIDKSKLIIDEKLKTKIDHFIFDSHNLTLPTTSKRSLAASNEADTNSNKKLKLTNESLKCMCCLNPKSTNKHLFKLESCEHFFCRDCLKNLNKICLVCKKLFDNSQLVRVY